jgi:hypothetical protein
VTGDVNGVSIPVDVDNGCAVSIMDLDWFLRNRHLFFFPGSPVRLVEFEQPPSLGVMLGNGATQAAFALCDVPLGLGQGVYQVTFLVMPHSNFEVALGLEFLHAYGVRITTRDISNPSSGCQLAIPTPPSHRKRGLPAPKRPAWAADRPSWVPTNIVRGAYTVLRERHAVTPVDPSSL